MGANTPCIPAGSKLGAGLGEEGAEAEANIQTLDASSTCQPPEHNPEKSDTRSVNFERKDKPETQLGLKAGPSNDQK